MAKECGSAEQKPGTTKKNLPTLSRGEKKYKLPRQQQEMLLPSETPPFSKQPNCPISKMKSLRTIHFRRRGRQGLWRDIDPETQQLTLPSLRIRA